MTPHFHLRQSLDRLHVFRRENGLPRALFPAQTSMCQRVASASRFFYYNTFRHVLGLFFALKRTCFPVLSSHTIYL